MKLYSENELDKLNSEFDDAENEFEIKEELIYSCKEDNEIIIYFLFKYETFIK